MARLLNFLLYQVGWFACVIGSARAETAMGITVAMSLVGIHLLLTTDRSNQARLLLVAAGIGLAVDSLLLNLGVYRFPSSNLVDGFPPLWMSVLWIQFATTFRYCLHWLSGRYALSGVLALIGAPLAFLAGEQLGAVSILAPRPFSLLLLGSLWAVAIPLLIYLSDRIHAAGAVIGYRGISPRERNRTE